MRVTAFLCAVIIAVAAFAADPNQKRGFNANETYQIGEIDHVNAFNGNVVITLPLGQAYHVGPEMQYRFVLSYNSKIWDYSIKEGYGAVNCVQQELPCSLRFGVPESTSTAGFGWTLSLGRLALPDNDPKRGWVYVAPDGAQHEFEHILVQTPPTWDPNTIVRARTADFSYLELRRDDPLRPIIRFPNGETHTFDEKGRLLKMEDRFQNWVKVAYTATQWIVTDGFQSETARTHTITLADKSALYPADQENFTGVIQSVDLAAFDPTPDGPNDLDGRAKYEFTYDDRWVGRGGGGDRVGDINNEEGIATLCITAPFLNRVKFPDGTTLDPAYKVFGTVADGRPPDCVPAQGDYSSVLDADSGVIKSLKLPTGGSIEWTHGVYPMNLQSCLNGTGYATTYVGVRTRTFKDRNGTPLMTWQYTPQLHTYQNTVRETCEGKSGEIPRPAEVFTNDIEISSGSAAGDTVLRTRNYFSVYPQNAAGNHSGGTPAGFTGREYGQPFTHNVTAGSVAGGDLRLLSAETFDCTAGCTTNTTPIRRRFVRYEDDANPALPGGGGNQRLVAERTVEVQDSTCTGGCYVDTQRSMWDDFGHYRKSVTSSNVPDSPLMTTFTNYTPDSTGWLLNLYTDKWTMQGSGPTARATKSRSTFDPASGALTSVRTYAMVAADPASISNAPNDLLSVSCRDASTAGVRGFVTSLRTFGGDDGSIPSNPCESGLTNGAYFVNHTYTFTTAALATHRTQYAGTTHYVADEVFDRNTGFARSIKDSAGVETTFSFDVSGRLTLTQPQGRVATAYSYSPAANPPSATMTQQCPTGSGASPCVAGDLTQAVYYFDDLGRLQQELHPFGGGNWASTWMTYDGAGRKKTVSVPTQVASASATPRPSAIDATTWDYDVLGRPVLVKQPDQSTTKYTYVGSRETTRFTGNAFRSKEISNGFGQLVEVRQRTAPSASDVVTRYQYDAGGRLSLVRMIAPDQKAQTRVFDYDGRGFLRWENQPEAGMSSYTYDSRGHVTAKIQSEAQSPFDLKYAYDRAERLLTVLGRNPKFGTAGEPEFRVMKSFTYGTANSSTPYDDLKLGKLVTASRYNYPSDRFSEDQDTYKITDTYSYRDASGRKTNRATTISRILSGNYEQVMKSVDLAVTYNALDLPQSIQYPTCVNCGLPYDDPDRSSMLYGYSNGRLVTIDGFVSGISYWPNGMRNLLDHSNGRRDQQFVDDMPRPASIAFKPIAGEAPLERCIRPSFISQPANATVPTGGGDVTLSVAPSGTGPFRYEWYRVSDFEKVGTTQSISVHVTATETFYVIVRNTCGFEESQRAKVTVGSCDVPAIQKIDRILQPDGRFLLQPDVMARQPRQYSWTRVSDGVSMGLAETIIVPAAFGNIVTYRLTVTDSCGSTSLDVAITPPPVITTVGLVATATGTTQIKIDWPASFNVSSYVLERRSGDRWIEIARDITTPPYFDNTVTANQSYAYRAYAVRSSARSAYSNSDVATTRTFTPAHAAASLSAGPFNEMLAAVNSVRAAVGWGAVSWNNILAATDPIPQPQAPALERHVSAARWRMNEALSALGVPLSEYMDPVLNGKKIKALHVNEVQLRAQ